MGARSHGVLEIERSRHDSVDESRLLSGDLGRRGRGSEASGLPPRSRAMATAGVDPLPQRRRGRLFPALRAGPLASVSSAVGRYITEARLGARTSSSPLGTHWPSSLVGVVVAGAAFGPPASFAVRVGALVPRAHDLVCSGLQIISVMCRSCSLVDGAAMATTAVSAPRAVPETAITSSPSAQCPPSAAIRTISTQTFMPWQTVRSTMAMVSGVPTVEALGVEEHGAEVHEVPLLLQLGDQFRWEALGLRETVLVGHHHHLDAGAGEPCRSQPSGVARVDARTILPCPAARPPPPPDARSPRCCPSRVCRSRRCPLHLDLLCAHSGARPAR